MCVYAYVNVLHGEHCSHFSHWHVLAVKAYNLLSRQVVWPLEPSEWHKHIETQLDMGRHWNFPKLRANHFWNPSWIFCKLYPYMAILAALLQIGSSGKLEDMKEMHVEDVTCPCWCWGLGRHEIMGPHRFLESAYGRCIFFTGRSKLHNSIAEILLDYTILYWLVVWNMIYFSIRLGMVTPPACPIFQRGRYSSIPPTIYIICPILHRKNPKTCTCFFAIRTLGGDSACRWGFVLVFFWLLSYAPLGRFSHSHGNWCWFGIENHSMGISGS
jgi:hypothetical protein